MDYLDAETPLQVSGAVADAVHDGCVEYRKASNPDEPPTVEASPSDVDGPGLGETQSTGLLLVTLLEFDWEYDGLQSFLPAGFEGVAALVEFESIDPSAFFVSDFRVYDRDGLAYDGASVYRAPRLEDGDLGVGRKRRGWVTFGVPAGSDRLELEFAPSSRDADRPLV